MITIGVATIAAAIGAGGLGEFIFRGIAMVDNGVILAGAIPAALMALAADLGPERSREAAGAQDRTDMDRRGFLSGLVLSRCAAARPASASSPSARRTSPNSSSWANC